MIVISSAYVLSVVPAVDPDLPAIGYRNVITPGGIVADSQLANYPASNLANPLTHVEWRSATAAEQYLTFSLGEVGEIDYVGIARHNFGTAAIAVSVEALIEGVWTEIVEPILLDDDAPLMMRFLPQSIASLRIRMPHGTAAPRAAVVYVGRLLDLARKVWVGHTPIPHGLKTNVANNMSDSGNFLGRIVLGESRESTVPLSLIDPDWHREYLVPFLKAAQTRPFFFAWRPGTYPREVGFCWFTNDPRPAPAGPSNLVALEWALGGIA